jgi:hypothetical protein
MSSDNSFKSKSTFVLSPSIVSLTFIKSSSMTLKVFPIQEKSGTSFTSLTHLGNLGIWDFTASMASQIASISLS